MMAVMTMKVLQIHPPPWCRRRGKGLDLSALRPELEMCELLLSLAHCDLSTSFVPSTDHSTLKSSILTFPSFSLSEVSVANDASPADVDRSQTVAVSTVSGTFEVVISLLPCAAFLADATAEMQEVWLSEDHNVHLWHWGESSIPILWLSRALSYIIYIYILYITYLFVRIFI